MIIDIAKNMATYENLSEKFKQAFEFLSNQDLENLEIGRYELDSDNLFVLIQEYTGKKEEKESKCEAHKKYIDIQYIISGVEKMGYAPIDTLEIVDPYNETKDVLFAKFKGDFTVFNKDMFAIFFPQDAHKPGVEVIEGTTIKKAVVKIKI